MVSYKLDSVSLIDGIALVVFVPPIFKVFDSFWFQLECLGLHLEEFAVVIAHFHVLLGECVCFKVIVFCGGKGFWHQIVRESVDNGKERLS